MADRYLVFGQIVIEDVTAGVDPTGRKVVDTAFTCTGAGTFKIHMANGTTGTVSGTNVQNSPVTLVAGENIITTTDAVADGNIDITIGTAANWNTDNSWAASSGGACGASVPTSSDNVYFDASSFTAASQVLTVDAAAYYLSMDWTGATNTPTLAGSQSISVYGSLTTILAMVWSHTGTVTFTGATSGHTINTNGLALSCAIGIGTADGGGWTLASDFNNGTANFTYNRSTFNTAGFDITCGFFKRDSGGTGVLTLGDTVINCTAFNLAVTTNLTVTANTATINISGTGACALGAANWNGASFNLNGTAHVVSGNWASGINVFTRNGTATKTDTMTITPNGADPILSCTTFAMKGNSATNRLLVQSSTLGTPAIIAATNWTGTQNVDLMDIRSTKIGGTDLSAITGGSGDCGGNTNITFTTAAAQTYTDSGDHLWSTAANWTSRVPLPQDDVTVGATITVDMPRIGKNITFTGTPTISLSNHIENYGSFSLPSGCTYTHNNKDNIFRGRSGGTLTTNGKTLYSVYNYSLATLTFGDAVTATYIVPTTGTTDFNDKDIVITSQLISTALGGSYYVRVINLGNGIITMSGTSAATKWNVAATSQTLNAEGSTIILTNSTANAQTFAGGGLTYNNVTVQGAGNYALTISGNNTFKTFRVDALEAAKTITGTAASTQTVKELVLYNPTHNVITMNSTGAAWTITGQRINFGGDYLSLTNVVAGMVGKYYAGNHSTDGTGNTNWIFRKKPQYVRVKTIGGV